MNSIRKWIRNVFGFSGNEINGFLILLPLMLVLVFSEPLYHAWISHGQRPYAADLAKLDSLVAVLEAGVEGENPVTRDVPMFSFDPNTAGVEDLLRLGFPPVSANRIAAYRRKGGVFRIKSDLLKIYGLDSALYNQLYKYIKLPIRYAEGSGPDKSLSVPGSGVSKSRWIRKSFDINAADTVLLKTVYGIGPVLAARIVRFRDGLGGFVSTGQLNEVYGLDSTVVKRLLEVIFIAADFVPEMININTADEQRLVGHPYIRYNVARALVNYRFQHGDFADARDIKKLSVLTPDEVERLLPYLDIRN